MLDPSTVGAIARAIALGIAALGIAIGMGTGRRAGVRRNQVS